MSEEIQAGEVLDEMILDGALYEWGITKRHLYDIEKFKIKANGLAEFCIERHPHLLGRSSTGKKSSAFATVIQRFELDWQDKSVKLLSEKVVDFELDIYELAYEDVTSFLNEGGELYALESEISKLTDEKMVEEFAEKKFGEYCWWDSYEVLEEKYTPPNFKQKMMAELKRVFVSSIISAWEDRDDFD